MRRYETRSTAMTTNRPRNGASSSETSPQPRRSSIASFTTPRSSPSRARATGSKTELARRRWRPDHPRPDGSRVAGFEATRDSLVAQDPAGRGRCRPEGKSPASQLRASNSVGVSLGRVVPDGKDVVSRHWAPPSRPSRLRLLDEPVVGLAAPGFRRYVPAFPSSHVEPSTESNGGTRGSAGSGPISGPPSADNARRGGRAAECARLLIW